MDRLAEDEKRQARFAAWRAKLDVLERQVHAREKGQVEVRSTADKAVWPHRRVRKEGPSSRCQARCYGTAGVQELRCAHGVRLPAGRMTALAQNLNTRVLLCFEPLFEDRDRTPQ
jgi:hypothetical protein